MDAFSEILSGVVLKGALFFNAEFSAPWGFNAPATQDLAPLLAPDAPHLLVYHFLVKDRALFTWDDEPIELEPGDVVVLPHGDAHEMCSAQGVARKLSEAMMRKLKTRDLSAMHTAAAVKSRVSFAASWFAIRLLCRPILQSLPPAFKVNLRTDRSGQWLEHTLLHLVEEAASENAGQRSSAGEAV
jgi:hypothetical protein